MTLSEHPDPETLGRFVLGRLDRARWRVSKGISRVALTVGRSPCGSLMTGS